MVEYENLLGNSFEVGTSDCFALSQKFFLLNYGIVIRNYARPTDWDADKIDIISGAFGREGFSKVEDWSLANLQVGDVLAMAIGTSKANHFAIYVGGNMIIHHVVNQLSNAEPLRDFWRKCTCYVLRHKDVVNEVVEKPTITIEELINARYDLQVAEATKTE